MEIPVDKVRKARKIAQEPISLETPIGEEEDSHLGDFIEDRGVVSPTEAVINLNLKEQTDQVLKTLTPREEKVIKMRFGLEDGSEHTLGEVGQSFTVTREAHPSDRGQGPPQAAPPQPQPQAPGIHGSRGQRVVLSSPAVSFTRSCLCQARPRAGQRASAPAPSQAVEAGLDQVPHGRIVGLPDKCLP